MTAGQSAGARVQVSRVPSDITRTIANASMDRIIRIWDANSGQELLTLKRRTHSLSGVEFSPDGAHLASADLDQTLKIWDGTPMSEKLTAHNQSLESRQVPRRHPQPDPAGGRAFSCALK